METDVCFWFFVVFFGGRWAFVFDFLCCFFRTDMLGKGKGGDGRLFFGFLFSRADVLKKGRDGDGVFVFSLFCIVCFVFLCFAFLRVCFVFCVFACFVFLRVLFLFLRFAFCVLFSGFRDG